VPWCGLLAFGDGDRDVDWTLAAVQNAPAENQHQQPGACAQPNPQASQEQRTDPPATSPRRAERNSGVPMTTFRAATGRQYGNYQRRKPDRTQ